MSEQLSINLSSDINYVYGVVNGSEATFSLTSPGIWSAVVPKSNDGKYVINITAYNNAGTPVNYNTTIYKLDSIMAPKTNWIKDDSYNTDDLNRVEVNTQFIAEYLQTINYNISLGTIITNRDIVGIDFLSSINRIENNIETIKNNFLTPPGWQEKKVWGVGMGFDYTDANRLENNLNILYEWALKVKDNYIYCGTFSCNAEWEGGLYG